MSADAQWRGVVLSGTTPRRQLVTFVEEWRAWLDEAGEPQQAAQRALNCLAHIDELQSVLAPLAKEARELLGELVAEVGAVSCQYGSAVPVAAGERVSWDTDALERLMRHPAYQATLAPLRRTTETKPSVRVTIGAKRKGRGKE